MIFNCHFYFYLILFDLRTVPAIATAHTCCASRNVRTSDKALLTQWSRETKLKFATFVENFACVKGRSVFNFIVLYG